MPSDWQRIEELFHDATALPAGARDQFLSETCRSDADLRREVESLLAADASEDQLPPRPSVFDDPAPGEHLGEYVIEALCGHGANGVVYRARDTRTDAIVAIKVFPPLMSAEQRRRYFKEAQAAATVEHQALVRLIEASSVGTRDYLVMEYVDGQTLGELIPEGGLPFDRAAKLARAILDGLSAAHTAGIVHRDLKPSNIMVTRDGAVKILDFGLAKLIPPGETGASMGTVAGQILGTACYLSPEQAEGRPVDARTDVFSIGAVFYEMLTGVRPFDRGSLAGTLSAILRDTPVALHRVHPEIPLGFSRAIDLCLEKDREHRPASAAALAAALEPRTGLRHRVENAKIFLRRIRLVAAAILLLLAVAAVGFRTLWHAQPAEANSIVVLPFTNMSGDPQNDYFSDGLTEEIINSLCRVPNLRVISRTSAFAFKGKPLDVRDIGRQLAVSHVLEGSVRQSGDRLRVTAQLIDARDGSHQWSHVWDERLTDVFAIQQAIADAIAGRLVRDRRGSKPRAPAPPSDIGTYRLYFRGRQLVDDINPLSMHKSVSYFEQSVERDPSFAPGYAGLGLAWNRLYIWMVEPEDIAEPRSKAALEKALALDPDSAESHAVLASLLHFHDWNHRKAEAEVRRALEIAPGSALANSFYGTILSNLQRHEESFAAHKRAISADPLDSRPRSGLALAYFHARRFPDAVAECDGMLKAAPDFIRAHLLRSFALIEMGRSGEALSELDIVIRLAGREPSYLAWRAYALAAAGRSAEASAQLNQLEEENTAGKVAGLLALGWSRYGDKARAIQWLEKAVEHRDPFIVQMNVEPGFDAIRSEPGFQGLREKVMDGQ